VILAHVEDNVETVSVARLAIVGPGNSLVLARGPNSGRNGLGVEKATLVRGGGLGGNSGHGHGGGSGDEIGLHVWMYVEGREKEITV